MKIVVLGSKFRSMTSEQTKKFETVCNEIGKQLASSNHLIFVCSDSSRTADYYVVKGASGHLTLSTIVAFLVDDEAIDKNTERFPFVKDRSKLEIHTYADSSGDLNVMTAIKNCDVALIIGGGPGMIQVERIADYFNHPIIPIACCGGVALHLLDSIGPNGGRGISGPEMTLLREPWQDVAGSARAVIKIAERLGSKKSEQEPRSLPDQNTSAVLDRTSNSGLDPKYAYAFAEFEVNEKRRRHLVLQCTRLNSWRGLYMLGCFDKRITFYSQQTRALELVRALFEVGELVGKDSIARSVAVIGGGAAGVSAAVAAAVKGANVTIFDEHDEILSLQANASGRYLHPNIFDYPEPNTTNSSAGLPLMDWDAGPANQVARRLRGTFGGYLELYKERLVSRCTVTISDIKRDELDRNKIRLIGNQGDINQAFDVVILAAGFGLDDHAPTRSYWSETGLLGPFDTKHKQQVLISGAGDGALIDIAIATLKAVRRANQSLESVGELTDADVTYFRHDEALADLSTILTDEEKPAIDELAVIMRKIDEEARDRLAAGYPDVDLFTMYENEIEVPQILIDRVVALRRNDTQVTFNYLRPGIFSVDSMLLNRLLTYLIIKANIVTRRLGPITVEGTNVTFAGPPIETVAFDTLVLRHGPKKGFFSTKFPSIASDAEVLKGRLADLRLTGRLAATTDAWYRSEKEKDQTVA